MGAPVDFLHEELFESKLHPPPPRPALVSRPALVDQLDASDGVPIVAVVAPAGYGKTTLLAEWFQRHPSRLAWLSVDRHDNDLDRMAAYVAASLDRIGAVETDAVVRRSSGRRSVAAVASRIAGVMSAMTKPATLVLDHLESLDNDECLDTIVELALHLPQGSRLALATRSEPPLPMARLRAERGVVELGVDQLAMTEPEASALLEAAGVRLDDSDLSRLVERTEGWPVGLYFAALALRAGGSSEQAGISFSGDDQLMADYLRVELLSRLSEADVTFLTRTAVLDRMTGPLCDAVLESTGSGAVLESLARANLFLVALDRHGKWYRYHHLVRDLLLAELERREHEVVTPLHVRAADWYEAQRMSEIAIEHAQAAGDVDRVNRLVFMNAPKVYGAGRREKVERWLAWLESHGAVEQNPAVASLGALYYGSTAQPTAAERWATAAEQGGASAVPPTGSRRERRGRRDQVLPDGSTLAAVLAYIRALMCRDGVDEMREDAETAFAALSARSYHRCAALVLQGLAAVSEGDVERADPILSQAVDIGRRGDAMPALIFALALRGLHTIDHRDWERADACAEQARSIVERFGLDGYMQAALAYVLLARVALHRGDLDVARGALTSAMRLRPLLTYAIPALSVYTLLELGRAYVLLDDRAGAREVLRQARDIIGQRPKLGVLPRQVEEVESTLDAMRARGVGASSLTAAELRLVPFLPTHLTYPQISGRLCLSRNTVKTQAVSIYQKLGVASRDEAIARLRECDLL